MPAYRRSAGSVTRSSLRVRVGGTAMGAGRRFGAPVPIGSTSYTAAPLGAGGWVTGIALSPDGNTRLVRTDTLGGWRWDTGTDKWVATTSGTSMPSPHNALDTGKGVQGITAANDVAYMAYNDSMFVSTNRGVTWSVSATTGPPTAPNTGNQRRVNRHMMVDPTNSAVCLYGSITAGAWYTTDTGATWTQVPSGTVPFGQDGASTPTTNTWGIPSVCIDGAGNWYVAPFGSGVYRSTNQGSTWTKISSDAQFTVATGIDYGPNGDIMIAGNTTTTLSSANSVVYRYRSGTWTQLTIPGTARAWRNVAFDRLVAGRVMVQGDGGYERISLDYGDTWSQPNHTFAAAATDVPWLAAANGGTTGNSFFTTTGGLQFDPVVTNRVWMSQGIGVWYADLPSDPTVAIPWQAQSRGIEQLVINDALAPPAGSTLTVGWDRPIFVVGETTGGGTYPYRYRPTDAVFGSAWHMDYSADDPTWLAASIGNHQTIDGSPSGYSTDGGLTWTAFATIPNNGTNSAWAGSMHVGQPGYAIWVSASSRGTWRTADSGATWTPVTISGVTISNLNTQAYYYYRRPVCSEKTAGSANTFYLHAPTVGFYRSTDAGATWTQRCNNTQFAGTDWQQMAYLKAVPGNVGHLFITPGWEGAGGGVETLGLPFKRSTDGGATWTNVPSITSVRGFDFGAPAPDHAYPTIYAIGWVDGVKGVYRSTDSGDTWTLLSTQPNNTIDFIRNIAASKDTFGLHWITTAGSGLIRGQLA